jgi:hypothetical protein
MGFREYAECHACPSRVLLAQWSDICNNLQIQTSAHLHEELLVAHPAPSQGESLQQPGTPHRLPCRDRPSSQDAHRTPLSRSRPQRQHAARIQLHPCKRPDGREPGLACHAGRPPDELHLILPHHNGGCRQHLPRRFRDDRASADTKLPARNAGQEQLGKDNSNSGGYSIIAQPPASDVLDSRRHPSTPCACYTDAATQQASVQVLRALATGPCRLATTCMGLP